MIRKFDDLGRLVIPKEMRDELGFTGSGKADINVVDNKLIITNPNKFDICKYIKEQLDKCENGTEALIYADILNKINENK